MRKPVPMPSIDELRSIFTYDGERLLWRAFRGSRAAAGDPAGCEWTHRGLTYIQVRVKKRLYYAHRIIWAMHYGEPKQGLVIDHVDGNGTNNRLSNLRLVEQAMNARNARRSASHKNACAGVYQLGHKRWQAAITINDRKKHLGHFRTLDEAVTARRAAEQAHGFTERHCK